MPTRGLAAQIEPVERPKQTQRSHAMVTRAVSTRHATAAVLHTYELLESILSALPLQKILDVRRVSKSWDAVIKRSKPLRTMLFLEAEPKKSLWVLDRNTFDLKPYEWGAREQRGEDWMHSQALSRPSICNPLLFKHDVNLRSCLKNRALTCEGLYLTAAPDLAKRRSIYHEVRLSIKNLY